MIHAHLVLLGEGGEDMEKVGRAIEPDNLPNMNLLIDELCLRLQFSIEKPGTLLTTMDDLLMNIKIAREMLSVAEER
ncbi:MAG: KEOPS complex subunit Pcc1 [Methanothrix sp.]|uniref:KEOPS complex subunit Pcc1 n=1 Tax=Methanothrix sp. TaxID=90426 RepID=UPI003BB00912